MPVKDSEQARVDLLIEAVVAKRMEESLDQLEQALQSWRSGSDDALAAHTEALRHVARANVLTTRVAKAEVDGNHTLLRDGVALGVLQAGEFEELTGKALEEVPMPVSLDDEAENKKGPAMPKKAEVIAEAAEEYMKPIKIVYYGN